MYATIVPLIALIAADGAAVPPCHYVVGDSDIEIAVDAVEGDRLQLIALGNVFSEGHEVIAAKVRLHVPEMRSRTLFELRSTRQPGTVVAQLAGYPRERAEWSEDPIEVIALATPQWFTQWAPAFGIAVTVCPSAGMLPQCAQATNAKRLVVVGREAGKDDPHACLEMARTLSANVVVLDAPWFGKELREPVVPSFDAAGDPLGRLGKWNWRDKPRFRSYRPAELLWMNRLAVADDTGRTLIEVFLSPHSAHILVASYLPWEEQLGRSETADAMFSALLRETALAPPPAPLAGRAVVHFVEPDSAGARRPVLARLAHHPQRAADAVTLEIVDLRGESEQSITARELSRVMDSAGGALLILGDDPALRFVRGLPEPDVEAEKIPSAVWLRADGLPPAPADQERLMRVLTRYRIPLNPTVEIDR